MERGRRRGRDHRFAARLIPPALSLRRRERFLIALLPVAFFAFDPIWTADTDLGEVYSWHIAWPARRLMRHAAGWGFLCGLGGAHHATAILVAGPLSIGLLVVVAARRRLRPWIVLTVLVAALVPLSSYGIIGWRASHPAAVQWPMLTPGLRALLAHASGWQYTHNLGRFAPSPEQRRFLLAYTWPFLFTGLGMLLLSAMRARRLDERALTWSLAASALCAALYAFAYGVNDPSSYFHLPVVLGLAFSSPLLAALLDAGARGRRIARTAGALAGIAALVLWVPWLRTGQERVRLYVSFDEMVHRMWQSIPMDSAIVFWTNDMQYRLQEYQLLGHEKPGIDVEHALQLIVSQRRQRFAERYGFDPGEGIVLHARAPFVAVEGDSLARQVADAVEEKVNRGTRLPVIHFDPEVPTVRLLKKPSAGMPGRAGAAKPD